MGRARLQRRSEETYALRPLRLWYQDHESPLRLAHRLPAHRSRGIFGEYLDIVSNGVVHHPAVDRAVLRVRHRIPETGLSLPVLQRMRGRKDHLDALLRNEVDPVAVVRKGQT